MVFGAFGAGLACSAAAAVVQAQAVAVQQAQQQGSGLAAGLAALGYGGSPLGALGSPAQLQTTGMAAFTDPRNELGLHGGLHCKTMSLVYCTFVNMFSVDNTKKKLRIPRTFFPFYHHRPTKYVITLLYIDTMPHNINDNRV